MKNVKRTLACLLAASTVAGILSGCGGNTQSSTPSSSGSTPSSSGTSGSSGASETDASKPAEKTAVANFNPEGFPIVNEKIKLKVVNRQTPVQKDFNEMVILKNFEEKSNIDVEWVNIPAEFLEEKKNIMMASSDLPDIFFKMNFSATDVAKYSKQGQFINLTPLVDAYAPNAKAALKEWPEVETGLTLSDGNIYSLSYVLGAPAITSGTKMFVNKEALDKTGKTMPTTTDEFADLLREFKKLDYNGNGKNDEVPLTCSEYAALEYIFYGSFGLGNRGGAHRMVDVAEDGTLRFQQTTDRYKELLQYMNMLYTEGLLDQEIFTMDMPKLIAKGEEGRALCYGFVNHSVIGTNYAEKSVGFEAPLKGPHGDQIWNNQGSALSGFGNFIITSVNKYPEASIRFADYWYSDDGIREYFMGIEGETYYIDDKGEYQHTDFVMKNPDGIMFEQVLGAYVPWAGGANPSIASNKYFKGGEMQPITKASADKLFDYKPEVWPAFVWDPAVSDEMATIYTDLDTYLKENRAAFVTGKKSFDEWDSYVKGFEAMQIKRYLEVYQQTRERYGL